MSTAPPADGTVSFRATALLAGRIAQAVALAQE